MNAYGGISREMKVNGGRWGIQREMKADGDKLREMRAIEGRWRKIKGNVGI